MTSARLQPRSPPFATFVGVAERLGGLTNRVYRLGPHILRVPGDGTSAYINRTHEAVAAQEAARVGVVTGRDPCRTRKRPDGDPVHCRRRNHVPSRVPQQARGRSGGPAQVLRTLHFSGAVFPVRFDLFAMVDSYLQLLSTKDVSLPDGLCGPWPDHAGHSPDAGGPPVQMGCLPL